MIGISESKLLSSLHRLLGLLWSCCGFVTRLESIFLVHLVIRAAIEEDEGLAELPRAPSITSAHEQDACWRLSRCKQTDVEARVDSQAPFIRRD